MFKRKSITVSVIFFFLVAVFILIKVVASIFFPGNKVIGGVIRSKLGKNSFSNFSYKTSDSKGREIVLHAEKVSEEKKDVYKLNKVKSTLTLSNGKNILISANEIIALQKDKMICNFAGEVQLSTASGILMQTEISTVDFAKKTAEGGQKIRISNDNMEIRADRYAVNLESKTADLFGNVSGEISSKGKINADHVTISFDDDSKDHLKCIRLFGNPTVKSQNYTLKSTGELICRHDSIESTSKTYLKYTHNNREFYIKSDKMLAKLNNSQIESVDVRGNLMIRSENITVKADSGKFRDQLAVITGNVLIMNEQGTIFGDTAEVDFNTGRVLLKKSRGILSGK